jgi:hypothetical protein
VNLQTRRLGGILDLADHDVRAHLGGEVVVDEEAGADQGRRLADETRPDRGRPRCDVAEDLPNPLRAGLEVLQVEVTELQGDVRQGYGPHHGTLTVLVELGVGRVLRRGSTLLLRDPTVPPMSAAVPRAGRLAGLDLLGRHRRPLPAVVPTAITMPR